MAEFPRCPPISATIYVEHVAPIADFDRDCWPLPAVDVAVRPNFSRMVAASLLPVACWTRGNDMQLPKEL